MKIYTRKGDKCNTTLLGGVPVLKNHLRLEAYGTIDELIAHIALLHDITENNECKQWAITIQDKLMIIAAHLSYDGSVEINLPSLTDDDILWLEKTIDLMEENLEPLHAFILPGGNLVSSQAHLCRTVCRRAERISVAVFQETPFDELILKYLNRLSDFLFVLARFLLKLSGKEEIKWNPRQTKI